jgi:hypothetical protein
LGAACYAVLLYVVLGSGQLSIAVSTAFAAVGLLCVANPLYIMTA